MKILQVVHSYPPYIGGIENHCYNLAKESAKLGNSVKVITVAHPAANAHEESAGVEVGRYFSLNAPWFSSVRLIPFLALRLLFENADVYCSHGYGSLMPFCTAIAAFLKRKPFVFTLHGYPHQKGVGGLLQSFYKLFIASVFLRIARKIISVTDANLGEIMREADGRKIAIIGNGVDEEKFSCRKKISGLETQEIAYIGRLDKYKGIDSLIRAFAIVKKKMPNAKLRIVGNDEGIRKGLEALCVELGIASDVEFCEVPYEQMPEAYERASAIVLPSLYEGLSLVLLEAIAFERPMLATPVGAAPKLFSEVYERDAGRFIFNSDGELAQKLIHVLENRNDYARIGARAREKLIKKYSWKEVARRTLEVYQDAARA